MSSNDKTCGDISEKSSSWDGSDEEISGEVISAPKLPELPEFVETKNPTPTPNQIEAQPYMPYIAHITPQPRIVYKPRPDDFEWQNKVIAGLCYIGSIVGFIFCIKSPLVSINLYVAAAASFLGVLIFCLTIIVCYMITVQCSVFEYDKTCCFSPWCKQKCCCNLCPATAE